MTKNYIAHLLVEGFRITDSTTTWDDTLRFRFNNIIEYKRHLAGNSKQVARNVLSKLFVYSTGAEIEFADRVEIERILSETEAEGYPMRSLIHHLVQSRLFRER